MAQFDEDKITEELRHPDTCRDAFSEVVKHYGRPLYWQIRRMVSSHDDADDLLQNTFLKAWDNIELFRGEAKLSTWLYRIAVNESINFLNKQRKIQNISLDGENDYMLTSLESDEYFDGDEIQKYLRKNRFKINWPPYSVCRYERYCQFEGDIVCLFSATMPLWVSY